MFKAKVRFALLILFLPFLLHATHILKDDILNPKASKLIEDMANELVSKTGVNGYIVATNENFPERFNLVEYSKMYEKEVSKPYVILMFAPNAVVTLKSKEKGRVAILPSSQELSKLYSKSDVMDATIDVIAAKDKNSVEDKYNIGLVQGFSELADQIADSKNIKMTTTIPNETRTIISFLKIIVMIGAILVFWIFMIRPLFQRIKGEK